MKNLLIVLFITFLSLNACGQANKNVPEKVKTSFTQKFPNAQKVKWDMENEKEWEAEFKMDGKKYSANFDLDGNWMETEFEINKKAIPANILAVVEKEFPAYKIEEFEFSENAEGKFYEFVVEKGESEYEVVIDENGNVIKKEEIKEDDNKD